MLLHPVQWIRPLDYGATSSIAVDLLGSYSVRTTWIWLTILLGTAPSSSSCTMHMNVMVLILLNGNLFASSIHLIPDKVNTGTLFFPSIHLIPDKVKGKSRYFIFPE